MLEEVCQDLASRFANVGYYHAGLNTAKRNDVQDHYMNGDLRILVATNAQRLTVEKRSGCV